MCIKNRVNDNFVCLIGKTKQEITGSIDTNEVHKAHDGEVMNNGRPLLNFHVSFDAVLELGSPARTVKITTQKGQLRQYGNIIGVTICFALLDNPKDVERPARDNVTYMQDMEASAVGIGLSSVSDA